MSLEDQLLLSQHQVLRSDLDLLALAKAMLSKRQSPSFSTSVWLSQAQLTQKARNMLAKVKNFLYLLDMLNQQPPRWDLHSLTLHLLGSKYLHKAKRVKCLHHRAPAPGTTVKSFLHQPVLTAGTGTRKITVLRLAIVDATYATGGHHDILVLLVQHTCSIRCPL